MSKVKICGLTREADIEAVNQSLPDYIGFVFAPSRRRLSIDASEALKRKLDPRIETVGVFVNEAINTIAEIYKRGIIELAQLHGDEDDEYIKRLKDTCGGCVVIKAVGIDADHLPMSTLAADYVLFDALISVQPDQQRGGVGKTFDWNVLHGYHGPPYFLAGGLTADTVAKALHYLDPYCVDVSSGVETDGLKDSDKIHEFIRIVRNYKGVPR